MGADTLTFEINKLKKKN